MNRRTFLLSSSAALGGTLFIGCAGDDAATGDAALEDTTMTGPGRAAGRTLGSVGVQLYTIRSVIQGGNVAQILQQVADIGYDYVEFAGYYDLTPAEIRAILDETGLRAPATHIGYDMLQNDLDSVLTTAQEVGHEYIVCPYLGEDQRASLDLYRQHAAFFNEVGQQCQDAGLQFAYHNHDFEFESMDGTLPFDVLLQETDPELVQFELDLYWITVGGQDPLAYLAQYPGRFPLSHVKDGSAAGGQTPVGQGSIDFASILAAADEAGMAYYFVEMDTPENPMQDIETSYAYVNQLQF